MSFVFQDLIRRVLCAMQAEPRAALSLASRGASPILRLDPSDLILYSAKASTAHALDLLSTQPQNIHTSFLCCGESGFSLCSCSYDYLLCR